MTLAEGLESRGLDARSDRGAGYRAGYLDRRLGRRSEAAWNASLADYRDCYRLGWIDGGEGIVFQGDGGGAPLRGLNAGRIAAKLAAPGGRAALARSLALAIQWLDNLEGAVGAAALLDAMPNDFGGREELRRRLEEVSGGAGR